MEDKNYSKVIHDIMIREMDDIGEYIVQKQCFELGIMPDHITEKDVHKLSSAISKAMVDFGEEKANKIFREIRGLIKIENELKSKKGP